MMKNLVSNSQRQNSESLANTIQGLYSPKGSCKKFWSLKAKVELSIFQDYNNGENVR